MGNIEFSNVMQNKTAYFSSPELDRMLIVAYKNDGKKIGRDYLLLLTLARTGRRTSEIVGTKPYTKVTGLRPCDVRDDDLIEWGILKKNHVKKRSKKGIMRLASAVKKDLLNKKPKHLLIAANSEYLQALRYYIKENNIGFYDRVFPITRRRVHQIVSSIGVKAKVYRDGMKIHPHMFRHSFAINWLKNHPNDPTALIKLSMLLAHSSISVTYGYAQFSQEDIKEDLNRMYND